MSTKAVLPIPPGQTYPPLGDTVTDTAAWERLLGKTVRVTDKSLTGGPQRDVVYRVVRNEAGFVLKPSYPVRFKATEHGYVVDGYCSPTNPDFAGWVDPKIPSGSTVANNAIFLVMREGPLAHFNNEVVDTRVFKDHRSYGPQDEFTNYLANGNGWTETKNGSVTPTISDAQGGTLSITTDTTDEDEVILATEGEVFLFAQNKPLAGDCTVTITEVSTNTANFMFGFASGNMNAVISDAGAGPPSSYSGAVIWKADGTLVWRAETSLAGTQDTDTDCGTETSGTAYQLEMYIFTTSSTSATAVFFIDGALVHTSTFTYTSATEMKGFFGAHTGTGSALTVTVKRAALRQLL